MKNIFSTGASNESASSELQSIMCCLPQIDLPQLGYQNLFRIINFINRFQLSYFQDKYLKVYQNFLFF